MAKRIYIVTITEEVYGGNESDELVEIEIGYQSVSDVVWITKGE